jgi:hypothetical protein
VLLHGEMQEWVQHLPAGDWLKVFVRDNIRRPPTETRPALTQLITANPREAALYRLRAREGELQLDFVAAEADWRHYVQLSPDHAAAWSELADYFDRRHQPALEVDALRVAGHYERALQVIGEQALPDSSAIAIYRDWVQHRLEDASVRQRFIQFLGSRKLTAAAEEQVAAYRKSFPGDNIYPIQASADLAPNRLAIYEREFQPLWPDELTKSYLKTLEESSALRTMVAKSRASLGQNPDDVREAGRLFLYWRQQNNMIAARRVLAEYKLSKKSRKAAWKADELYTIARLFEKLPDVVEAADLYYTLYNLPGGDANSAEQSLSALANLLLTNPQQPIRFGSSDLSFYKDIATLDRSPGFLNGILSLILNGTGPRWEYAKENTESTAYFHRSAAAELLALLDRRFPQSANRASLHALLIQAYNTYGDDETVIRSGRAFLAAFPRADGRIDVALTVADALARRNRTREEFALYDQMLNELGHRGAAGLATNSPVYIRVFDRYLARLAAAGQPLDAVRLYRREIDRNPDDAGLYERLAAFLDQNNMAAETEAVYRQALAKFTDRGWYAKLARWYLRRQRGAEIGNLTRQLTDIFSGTELERYFADIVTTNNLGSVPYRQLNLYAHDRFPGDLVFVYNLLAAYRLTTTRDDAAAMALLRQYWFYDEQLRAQFFAALSSSGKLDGELAAAAANPSAAQFIAEGEAWRSHFEQAAQPLKSVAEAFPGDRTLTARASSLYRSLATVDDRNTAAAVTLARFESRSDPRDRATLAKIGDIYADRERFAAARPSWDAMPFTAPGTVDAWRDAATVFWDYYLYDDALRVIRAARTGKSDSSLLAFEAGAIYEGKRQEDRAVAEYISGYLAGDNQSQGRIIKLARRAALRDTVDRLTSAAANRPDADWTALSLRVAVLRQMQRGSEVSRLLLAKIAATRSLDLLKKIEDSCGSDLAGVRQRAIERQIAVAEDPVEQARLRISLVRFFESQKDLADATRTIDALYREHPQILGVVRATVDYYTRNQRPTDAVRVLIASAGQANGEYRDQFTLEAARLATGARAFDQARTLLQPLLQRNPYNSEYLAAMAGTYLQAGDDSHFRDFQMSCIKTLRESSLAPADRIARIAALRRNLIPALDRLGDYAGAADQYIEIMNAYPEDEGLIREASIYAARHALGARLTGFYRKTIADAPKDYRWPMVLARVETALEDFPSAIAAYDGALKARPDRKDLLAAREALEERLMQFDRAIARCQTLYERRYHDPQWMQRSASLKARLGRREEAVRDLRTAVIGEGKETPEALMIVAKQLDDWSYSTEASTYADQARKLKSEGLDLGLWARIMVRARRFNEVLPQFPKAPAAVNSAGQTVKEFYTPEEMAAVDAELRKTGEPGPMAFAEAAEFTELQSDLLNHELTTAKPTPHVEQTLVTLEMHRGRFEELGRAMESYAQRMSGDPQAAYRALAAAENAWRSAGNRTAELRVLGELNGHRALTAEMQNRYFLLLDPAQRSTIVALSRDSNPAVAFAVGSGNFAFAQQAIQSRGSGFLPLWSTAYTALAAVYDDIHTPETDAAFQSTLGGGTIGERVRRRADTNRQAVGSIWFYYGARYGEYLARANAASARDYLPASVEVTPGNPNAYFDYGSFYEERGQSGPAMEQYQAVLQLDADRGDAENAIARVLWHDNRRDDALRHWRASLAAFDRVENRGVRVPETFWSGVTGAIDEIGRAKQITTLQPEIEKLLRGYSNINGAYRTYELLNSAMHACLESNVDYGWVLTIASDSEWLSDELLNGIGTEFHLSPEQQEEIARRRIDLAVRHSGGALIARLSYIELLLDHGKTREAQQTWDALSAAERREPNSGVTELKLSGMSGTLPQLLAGFRADPSKAPPLWMDLNQAADFLRWHSHEDVARMLLEYIYQRKLDLQQLEAANFLGLAGVYLESGATDRALQVLRRMNLISGEEFETFVPAATLLIEHGKTAEAIPFLRDRVKAVPWDTGARLQLARLLSGDERQSALTQLVQNVEAPYADRAAAARLVANPAADGSTELGLLQRGKASPAEARKPFYVEARRMAGLYREALAIRPSSTAIRLEALHAGLQASQDSAVFAILPGLSRFDAATARDVSQAFEREGDLASALRYVQIAINEGMDLSARKKQLESEQQRRTENAHRAPTIKDSIEQDHAVQPRVPGRAS